MWVTTPWAAALALGCALVCAPLTAQVAGYGDKQTGENSGDQLPRVLQKVGVAQRLNQPLPLDAQFVDDAGKLLGSTWALQRRQQADVGSHLDEVFLEAHPSLVRLFRPAVDPDLADAVAG